MVLSTQDVRDIDETLDEAATVSQDHENFEGEVIFSTDGKHSVIAKAKTLQGRRNAYVWASKVYEIIKEKYGTKQEQAVRVYANGGDLGKCPKCGADNRKSLKGKVYCSAKCWLKEI